MFANSRIPQFSANPAPAGGSIAPTEGGNQQRQPNGGGNGRNSKSGRTGGNGNTRSGSAKPRLSKAEQDELRAANKCFECKEVSHLARNCPNLQKAVPSHLHNSAIRMSNIDLLGKRHLDTIRCSNISVDREDSSRSHYLQDVVKGIRKRRDLAELEWLKKVVLKEYFRSMISRRKREDSRFTSSGEVRVGIMDGGVTLADTGEQFRAFIPLNIFSDNDLDWFDTVYGDRLNGAREFILSAAVGSYKRGPAKATAQVNGSERSLQRNRSVPKDFERKVPRPVVVEVFINGKPAQALLDSGSMADFISTRLVDQLNLKKKCTRQAYWRSASRIRVKIQD